MGWYFIENVGKKRYFFAKKINTNAHKNIYRLCALKQSSYRYFKYVKCQNVEVFNESKTPTYELEKPP